MSEQHERYQGRDIVVRQRLGSTPEASDTSLEREVEPEPEEELTIDGEAVFTVRASGNTYIASGFAFSPESSLMDLAKRMIDYDEAVRRESDNGHS